MTDPSDDEVREANIAYHTLLAKDYDESQPHFRSENQARVRQTLERYAQEAGANRLLDLGCGTGFVLSLAQPHFERLCGVDITQAMLDVAIRKFARQNLRNIDLYVSSTEALPFQGSSFNVVTAYSFLHHLCHVRPTIEEAYRVLKKGGIFFSDLDPNFYFWDSVKKCVDCSDMSELLRKDVGSICHMPDEVQRLAVGLTHDVIRKAEFVEGFRGGFKPEELEDEFLKVGFSKVQAKLHWFWQEGKVIGDLSAGEAEYFEDHLRLGLPMTKHLFKYFSIKAVK